MKERPILFNSEMVRAILYGRKTQTRWPMKEQPHWVKITDKLVTLHNDPRYFSCPFGKVGDRLWVRETWAVSEELNKIVKFSGWPVKYFADGKVLRHGAFYGDTKGKKRPSIHMPRWASRILLEVVDVRIERLSDTSEADAKAEGFETYGDFVLAFDEIYKNKRLPQNPYLWVCEFKVLNG